MRCAGRGCLCNERRDKGSRSTENAFGIYDGTKYNNDSDEMPAMGADNGLQLADLTGKDYDDADWDKLLDQTCFLKNYTDQCWWMADRRNQISRFTQNCHI